MQNQDVHFPGVIVNTTTSPSGVSTTSSLTPSGRKIVESGPVLPGNKHTPNPWSYRVFKQQGPHGTWVSKEATRLQDGVPVWTVYTSQGSLWESLSGRMPQPGASIASDVYNRALTKLYNQIRNSDVNLAVSVGEAKETYKMIKAVVDGAIAVKKTLKGALRGNNLAGVSRKLSGAWLGYAYGIRPLVSDVRAMLNHVASNPSVLDVSTRSRASGAVIHQSLVDDFSTGREACVDEVISDSRWCQIGVTWTVGSYELNELSRITSLFPPTLMWELTTLSFVADWFFDVGSYLANLEASFGAGLVFKCGYVTESRRVELSHSCSWSQKSESWSRHQVSSNWTRTATETVSNRILLKSFPSPRLPTLSVPLGSEQLLSLAALLRTIGLAKY